MVACKKCNPSWKAGHKSPPAIQFAAGSATWLKASEKLLEPTKEYSLESESIEACTGDGPFHTHHLWGRLEIQVGRPF